MALLEVKGLSKSFGGLMAVNNAGLTVEEGRPHSIIGPNGAGKSTFLNMIIGRLKPDKGSVLFSGQSLIGLQPQQINQRGVVRVFQSPAIYPEMTVLENVTVSTLAKRDGTFKFNFLERPLKRKDAVTAAEEALTEVDLIGQQHEEAKNLSYGNKRRLELAMCLAQKPRLLLLDEPTAGMSQSDTIATINLLQKLGKNGEFTKVIIEHDMHVVFTLAEHITVLHQGTVIADGSPDEIKNSEIVQEAYLGGMEE
ncbi:MAG: ABC transporter ATP-binding protein [Trueperaceae bacterium]|nr:ABC transporter ATP-binding protein [Trueperaceae bacterium]